MNYAFDLCLLFLDDSAVEFDLSGSQFMRVAHVYLLFVEFPLQYFILVQLLVQSAVHRDDLVPHFPQLAFQLDGAHQSVLAPVVSSNLFSCIAQALPKDGSGDSLDRRGDYRSIEPSRSLSSSSPCMLPYPSSCLSPSSDRSSSSVFMELLGRRGAGCLTPII